jgi:flagellar FliJ protein
MEKLVKLAQTDERQAADKLASSRRDLDESERRLAEMKQHRQEYLEAFKAQGAQSMGAAQMCDYRRFLSNLDIAIAQMEQQLRLKDRLNEQRKTEWFSNHSRTNALDDIRSKYSHTEQRYEEGKLQTEMDERSQHTGNKENI